ncbi:type II CRISPR RNA-guided endonuclease Cas9 [Oceanobacillus bengalensis]|uniref:CRISPR-associated endonuclease Cas9 n=1 Tax=Oceanobacillus bengalensis TaxID=1435466 RepID=A0A494YSV9_9BACI|nr:type II CRISPR RNA-guided endonuclease Cas9 [Oceanobacillus bengalensis]RKQ13202.1 type II CRISPR RNA-guided endonuclease Cas9 [Oceanobacillus bengalensis]
MRELDYRIGLDIGTNSVGWGVIELEKNESDNKYRTIGIVDSGVRMFDKAEIPKTGASLAEPRRLARSARRRLRRRSERRREIRNLLIQFNIVTEVEMEHLYPLNDGSVDIWDIRIDGLDRLLANDEWARLLIHLAQRRGFKSNRKSEQKDKETGKVLTSIQQNKERLDKYRTVGEMWGKDPHFAQYDKRHNSRDEYIFNVSRYDLELEIVTLFETQRKLGSSYASEELQVSYLKIWNHQLPFASGNAILNKVGFCSLEDEERRIPKATYTFQYYMALDKINRIRIGKNVEAISMEQRQILLHSIFNRDDLVKRKSTPDVKYSDIRKWLKLDDELKFNDLMYDPEATLSMNEKLPFVNLSAYYEIKKVTDSHAMDTGEAYDTTDYDAIGYALTVYKTDKDIHQYLRNPNNIAKRVYSEDLIQMLLSLSYTKFGHLSSKAIQNLLPLMEEGLPFKLAADQFGYDTTGLQKVKREKFLPPIPNDIANPVVKRALTQSRKIVNAIIKRYGSPMSVHIELARELSKTHEERSKLQKNQKANFDRNAGAIKVLAENGILQPKGHDIVRYKLWEEQDHKCAYSQKSIPPEVFFGELRRERNSTPNLDVDHILPYSKSFMDNYQNKVLVYSDENRKKGNRIPFDYLKDNPEAWERFEIYVNYNTKFSKGKKQYLLKKEFTAHEEDVVKERHLNDTRFISRFFKNFMEKKLEPKDPHLKKWVVTVSGQVTAHLRSRFGLSKHRDETHLHHALDAIVVACTDDGMIRRVTNYHKVKESSKAVKEPLFPRPWDNFRDELLTHLAESANPKAISQALEAKISLPRYMMVSRMARYSVTGAAHKETIMINGGIDEKTGKTIVVKRVPLAEIKFDEDGDFSMVNKVSDLATYHAIKERYLAFGGNVKEAFKETLYKPSEKGKGNPIRRVKVEIEKRAHVREVNRGIAQNGNLVRIDIFLKEEQFYMVPIYVMDTSLPELPDRVVTARKGYEQWTRMDDSFIFQFSLYPYDLVRVKRGEDDRFLYFNSIDIDSNRIYFKEPNFPHKHTENRIGLKGIDILEKYKVGILGDITRVNRETRQAFKKKNMKQTI